MLSILSPLKHFAFFIFTLHHIIDLTLMLFKLIRVPIWLSVRRSINMHESRDLEFTHKNETKLFRQLWNPIWQGATYVLHFTAKNKVFKN